jgi:hypothetical protein
MSVFRNVLTALGLVAIVGILVMFAKPEWMSKLASKPSTVPMTTSTTTIRCMLTPNQDLLVRSTNPAVDIDEKKLFENRGETNRFPGRSLPCLVVINSAKKEVHYRLFKPEVKSIKTIRVPANADLKTEFKAGDPMQAILWVNSNKLDLEVEIEVELNELVPVGTQPVAK